MLRKSSSRELFPFFAGKEKLCFFFSASEMCLCVSWSSQDYTRFPSLAYCGLKKTICSKTVRQIIKTVRQASRQKKCNCPPFHGCTAVDKPLKINLMLTPYVSSESNQTARSLLFITTVQCTVYSKILKYFTNSSAKSGSAVWYFFFFLTFASENLFVIETIL